MNADEIGTHSARLIQRMMDEHEPGATMISALTGYANDESLRGRDMVNILAASTVGIAQMLNSTTARSIGVMTQLLSLLYADKSPRQLAIMASGLLAGVSTEETEAAVRVVLVRRHE